MSEKSGCIVVRLSDLFLLRLPRPPSPRTAPLLYFASISLPPFLSYRFLLPFCLLLSSILPLVPLGLPGDPAPNAASHPAVFAYLLPCCFLFLSSILLCFHPFCYSFPPAWRIAGPWRVHSAEPTRPGSGGFDGEGEGGGVSYSAAAAAPISGSGSGWGGSCSCTPMSCSGFPSWTMDSTNPTSISNTPGSRSPCDSILFLVRD